MIALLSAALASLLFTLVLTPSFIRLFRHLGWGQIIRVDGPTTHHVKAGTPTKGGIVFISGAVFGYFVGHLVTPGSRITASGLLVIFLTVGLGLIGFLDDFTKTRRGRSLGLTGWQKITGQVAVTSAFSVLALLFADPTTGLTPASTSVSFTRDIGWLNLFAFGSIIGIVVYVVWINLLAVAASNAVNLTDGADGLAAGAMIISLAAYVFIGMFQSRQACQNLPVGDELAYKCFEVRDPLDLAIIAAALSASLVGYLWYSAPPAKMFMGDVGSLGLGGALASLAVLTRTELLLLVIGGLYLSVTGSVILQVGYFKLTHGKRLFLIAPLHHHLEMKGWEEVTITIRFWIIAGLCTCAAVGIFYSSWLAR